MVGAVAVLGDGGLVGPGGAHGLALAARRFAVPLLVPAGFYKLSPSFVWAEERLNPAVPPASLVPADRAHLWGRVQVCDPLLLLLLLGRTMRRS